MNLINAMILLVTFSTASVECGSGSNTTNYMIISNNDFTSPLISAVSKKDLKLVAEILRSKPDMEVKDNKGRTALMIATYNQDNLIAEMLIKAGANVNAQDSMLNSPFLYAGASGNLTILKLCLANGANFDIYNRYGGTALIPAAEKRHLEVVKVLSELPDYPIDHINNLGWTALLEAIILGPKGKAQVAIVKILVEAGCDVNIADKEGITPLQHAKNRGMDEIVNILLEANALN